MESGLMDCSSMIIRHASTNRSFTLLLYYANDRLWWIAWKQKKNTYNKTFLFARAKTVNRFVIYYVFSLLNKEAIHKSILPFFKKLRLFESCYSFSLQYHCFNFRVEAPNFYLTRFHLNYKYRFHSFMM